MTGHVYKSTGSWYTVKTDLGYTYECRIKGKFRMQGIKSTNPISVGDVVDFELETDNDAETGVIHNIHDRKNYIVRKSVNLSKQTHIIAANLDQVFLMITINNPPTLTSFIDRFLVTAEAYSIKTVLLFNKIDTYDEDTLNEVRFLAHIYRKIGYECIGVSATTGKNVDKVKALMLHKTTFAEMFDLSFDAKIIDTPGIKGFGIVDMEREEIGDYFPEIFKLKQDCKFNNCLHVKEPKCAVKDALENDEIAYSRYRSYLQMLEGEDEHYRTDIWE